MDLRNYTSEEFQEEWAQMSDRDKSRLRLMIAYATPERKKMRERKPTYVYFIASNGLIKIGKSNDVAKRFSMLRTASSADMALLGCISESLIAEEDLHTKFKHICRRYEWFEDCAELRDYIATHATQEVEQPAPGRPRKRAVKEEIQIKE